MANLLTLKIVEGYTRPVVMVGKKVTCLIDTGADTPVWTRGSKALQKEFAAERVEGKVFILSGFGMKSEAVDVYNYYEALRKSSIGWHDNTHDYSEFIKEFLVTVYMCYKELDKRFAVVGNKKITKQTRVEATVLNSLTPISKSEICKILPDVSATTVEAVLSQMVKDGSVRKVGAGRNTAYIKQ